uniref:2EXR domain-containing protein n=1 Tax=Bionectria ochroleuca TaxID=29856 RepID=A0A8H7N3G5_BIOOC
MPPTKESIDDQLPPAFTGFSKLPFEIRVMIWSLAMPRVPEGRTIEVAVYYDRQSTKHSCHIKTGKFCDCHSSCPEYIDGQPFHEVDTVADGYFALDPDFPLLVLGGRAVEDQLQALSLVCRESCDTVYKRYPQTMRVHREKWYAGVDTRTVRFDPGSDILIIQNISHARSYCVDQRITGIPVDDATSSEPATAFPQHSPPFATFRQVLSTFQNVAFRYANLDVLSDRPDGEIDPEDPEVKPIPNIDIIRFMTFMASMKSCYLWLDSMCWPEVQMTGLSRVEDLVIFGEMLFYEQLIVSEAADEILEQYKQRVVSTRDHRGRSAELWYPDPQDLDHMGCYLPTSWLEFAD